MNKRLKEDIALVEELCEIPEENLNNWEMNFVNDLDVQVIVEGKALSPKQRRKVRTLIYLR